MLNILTRPPTPFFAGAPRYFLKWALRKALGKKRGPDAVLESLKRGLNQIGRPFVINAPLQKGQTVNVISNIAALRYAIARKRSSGIDRLVAGPNLVVLPDEHDSLLASPDIDIVLAVSPWIMELYGKIVPALIPKMYIWPAGVQEPSEASNLSVVPHREGGAELDQNFRCIIFKKKVPEVLHAKIIQVLDEKRIRYAVFEYGTFKQADYFAALESIAGIGNRGFMIYLQESESQGIALQEAWIRNVPTLVWNKGSYTSTTGISVTGNVAAPFLTDEAGMLFSDAKHFESALDSFIHRVSAGDYRPGEYCRKNLTDKASAEAYLLAIGL